MHRATITSASSLSDLSILDQIDSKILFIWSILGFFKAILCAIIAAASTIFWFSWFKTRLRFNSGGKYPKFVRNFKVIYNKGASSSLFSRTLDIF
jgi:hypothetical protein